MFSQQLIVSGPIGILAYISMLVMFMLLLVQMVRLYIQPRPMAEVWRWLFLLPVPTVIGVGRSSFWIVEFFRHWESYELEHRVLVHLQHLCIPAAVGATLTLLLYVVAFPLIIISPSRAPGAVA